MNAPVDMDLGPLLDPKTIVVVGASPDFMRTGGIPIEAMLKNGFPPERLLLVNPKYGEIAGLRCYPSLAALPFAPDLAVLAIRASETLGALRQAHAAGARAAVLFASGFAEDGTAEGIARQEGLKRFAAQTGMLIGGPNALGHANLKEGTFPTFLRLYVPPPPRGDFALIAQSGNMVATLARCLMNAGVGFTYLINTGNEACLEFSAYLEHAVADPQTRAIVGYVEEVRDGARFLRAALAARAAGKPIFLLKAGRSNKGAEAVASHTAAMAGSSVAYDAAFRQIGVATSDDPARLADLVYLNRLGRSPAGRRVAVVSISGAACAILADCLSREGVAIPTLDEATQAALKPLVPSYGMIRNPVDLTGQVTNERAAFGGVCDALLASPGVDGVVIYLGGYLLDAMAPALIEAARPSEKPIVVIDTGKSAARAALEAAGIAVFEDISRAVAAYAGFAAWKEDLRRIDWRPADARAERTLAFAGGRTALSEVEAKNMLGAAGVPVIGERACASAEAAAVAARALGFPVAVKILSADILHKSDIGGVRVGLPDEASVRAAFDEIMLNARTARPDAVLQGVVVQAMAPAGASVLIGVRRDATFGPMMTVGLGGVLTEIYADLAHRLLPVGVADAHAMLSQLKSFPLLDGYRGAPRCDRDALADAMSALSDFVLAHADDIAEVELNPVIVSEHAAVAVDALVILQPKNK